MMSPASADPDTSDPGTSGSSLRERNVEGRRQQILQAARVLLSRGGIGALSMRKLADEAQLDDIRKAQQQRVDEATAFALDSPPPDPAGMEYALYAD